MTTVFLDDRRRQKKYERFFKKPILLRPSRSLMRRIFLLLNDYRVKEWTRFWTIRVNEISRWGKNYQPAVIRLLLLLFLCFNVVIIVFLKLSTTCVSCHVLTLIVFKSCYIIFETSLICFLINCVFKLRRRMLNSRFLILRILRFKYHIEW